MGFHFLVRAAVAVSLCASFAACTSQNGVPATTAFANARAASARPQWSRVSIGKFADPYGVAVDNSGNVYVADPGSKSIVKVAVDGTRTTVGDFSVAAGNKFDPQGVSIAQPPNLIYVADKGSGEVWVVRRDNSVGTVFGPIAHPLYARAVANSQTSPALFTALATYLPLSSKGLVRCLRADCKHFIEHPFANPYGVAVDNGGNVYVADAGAKAVYLVETTGFTELGKFADPYGIAVTPDGAHLYVADAGAKKVFEGTPDGSWSEIGTFGDPYGVAVDASGNVYVADPGTKDVWKLTSSTQLR